jgi:hypothetical protein
MTPKLTKGTYDNRFNSTPVINIDSTDEPQEKESLISSLKIISPIRKKSSLDGFVNEESKIDEF